MNRRQRARLYDIDPGSSTRSDTVPTAMLVVEVARPSGFSERPVRELPLYAASGERPTRDDVTVPDVVRPELPPSADDRTVPDAPFPPPRSKLDSSPRSSPEAAPRSRPSVAPSSRPSAAPSSRPSAAASASEASSSPPPRRSRTPHQEPNALLLVVITAVTAAVVGALLGYASRDRNAPPTVKSITVVSPLPVPLAATRATAAAPPARPAAVDASDVPHVGLGELPVQHEQPVPPAPAGSR